MVHGDRLSAPAGSHCLSLRMLIPRSMAVPYSTQRSFTGCDFFSAVKVGNSNFMLDGSTSLPGEKSYWATDLDYFAFV